MIPNRNTHPLTKISASASESYLKYSILYNCVDSNKALAHNIGKPIILTQLCMSPAYPMSDAPIANHSLATRL